MSSWKNLLLRLGDKSPEYGVSSDTCFGALRRELDHSQTDVLEFLLTCAEHLPHKIPLYGTLIGLINLENEDFGKQLVEKTKSMFQAAPHYTPSLLSSTLTSLRHKPQLVLQLLSHLNDHPHSST